LTPSNKSKDILLTETKRFFKIFSYYQGKALFYFNNQSDKQIELELKNLKSEYLIIAFVGRLNREKNAQLCIDIFSRVSESNKNVYLVIFGSGEEEESLKAYVKSSNLERIKFYGYVNNANIYMKYFDILILTSKREGMPIVVWEAMNNSIPVLSTKVGGVEEILTENKCGILFKKKNILDGVVNLLLIIKDKDLRVSLGENGKKAIDTKYSLKNFTNFFENFYNQILNEK